ncbi:dynein light chain roadblock-type 1-like [Acropora palmata]|uniref:dynein light chain roadblock-type 1-like n=1 Tax=Acropora palmata TaxID=6131 RepID=UPI003D9FE087
MSNLGKLKPSHLYIYDRVGRKSSEEDLEVPQSSGEIQENFKINFRDDGLGKYRITPLGNTKDTKELDTVKARSQNHTSNGEKKSVNSVTKKKSEVEELLKRIQGHKGVMGIIIVNNEGIPIRTTLDNSTTVQYAGLIHTLTAKARSTVRDIDPQNDLTFLRIRSKKHEIMIAPDKEYLMIVIQNPSSQ